MKLLTALVTPFTDAGAINYDCLNLILDDIKNKRCDGVVVAGTTGENTTLLRFEKINLLIHIINYCGDTMKVYFNIGSASTGETVDIIREVDHLDFDGYLVVTPYYSLPPAKGIIRHYEVVAAATAKDIMIYHNPRRTGIRLSYRTIKALSEIPHIRMIKDASGNRRLLRRIKHHLPLEVYLGHDRDLLFGLKHKLDGIISILANAHQEELFRVVSRYEQQKTLDLLTYRALCAVQHEIDKDVNPIGIKKHLRKLGIPVGTVRLPLLE